MQPLFLIVNPDCLYATSGTGCDMSELLEILFKAKNPYIQLQQW